MLRALEAEGLVTVAASTIDGRVRVATLTVAGLRERARLDERSDALALSILEPLDGAHRDKLVAAMRVVERLLTASMVSLDVVDPEDPHAIRCLRAYYAELQRRDPARGFDPLDRLDGQPRGGAWRSRRVRHRRVGCGEAVGCGAVKHGAGGASDIERMWVAEAARGLGVGRRLLAELERLAAERRLDDHAPRDQRRAA